MFDLISNATRPLSFDENGHLLCPKCGFDYLHLTKVHTSDQRASLVFYCEGCGMHGDQRLTFDQYKGHTTGSWEEGANLGPWSGNV